MFRLGAAATFLVGLSQPAAPQVPTPQAPAPWDVSALPWNLQNWVQAISWALAALAAAYAIGKGLRESRANRQQRVHELRWRQVQAAKALNDEMMSDSAANDAMLMLDYPSGRDFTLPGNLTTTTINKDHVLAALSRSGKGFVPPLHRFIRDAFDSLLYRMGTLEHYISRRLVEFPDVVHPIDYYVGRMKEETYRKTIQKYIDDYHFVLVKNFLVCRFKWPPW